MPRMSELVFEVTQEVDGGYVAEALGESIFTQGDTWDALCANAREAHIAQLSWPASCGPSMDHSHGLRRFPWMART